MSSQNGIGQAQAFHTGIIDNQKYFTSAGYLFRRE
jgi:hypothetical protein